MGGEVVEGDADALGFWEVDIHEFAHAKGEVVSVGMTRETLTLRQERRARTRLTTPSTLVIHHMSYCQGLR